MNIEDIKKYVVQTRHNVNPNQIETMLNNLIEEETPDIPNVLCLEYESGDTSYLNIAPTDFLTAIDTYDLVYYKNNNDIYLYAETIEPDPEQEESVTLYSFKKWTDTTVTVKFLEDEETNKMKLATA